MKRFLIVPSLVLAALLALCILNAAALNRRTGRWMDQADRIAQLPAGQREAITLYYYEGFSAQEVAQALGVPRPTACMRLSRGRKRLRWLIETEGRNEP